LDVQKEIVAEIDGYQRIIDGAKQVIANWKPVIPIDPSWPLVWLRDLENSRILELRRGQVISKTALENDPGDYPVYSAAQQNNGEFGRYGKYMFDEELVSWSIDGGGKFFYRPKHKYSVTNVCGYIRVLKPQALNCHFLYCVLAMSHARLNFDYTYKAHPSVIRDKYQVPLPPLDTQQRIVSEIENQERMVESCKALVSTYEAKIKVTVARLWDEQSKQ
jgi:type I restriction enzyme S subunit